MSDRLHAVIVAAGAGTRMDGVDKLFAPIGGRPVLAHAIHAFQRSDAVSGIVLVVSEGNAERVRKLAEESGATKVREVVPGGSRRQDSVRGGLDALRDLDPDDYVAVHDGARPLVTPELIERGLDAARGTGAAVPALPVAETVKEADGEGRVVRTVDRSRLYAVQTPQVFRYDLLSRAHREITHDATDDAAMVESLGVPVTLYAGDRANVKITTPADIELVEALLRLQAGAKAER